MGMEIMGRLGKDRKSKTKTTRDQQGPVGAGAQGKRVSATKQKTGQPNRPAYGPVASQ